MPLRDLTERLGTSQAVSDLQVPWPDEVHEPSYAEDPFQARSTGPDVLVSVNPADGRPFSETPRAGGGEIDRAVEGAVHASSLWRGISPEERGRRLRVLADTILSRADEIARLVTQEQGKPLVESLTLEVLPALDHLRFLARHAGRLESREALDERQPLYAHKEVQELYDPLGVVALVTPFPLPFAIPLVQVGAAVAMGNAAVLKPSEQAPLCGLKIGELCEEAGLPSSLVSVVTAGRQDTLHLVAHPRVDKVFLTGSRGTGQEVMSTAGCSPRPVVLSLGGKHPSLVAGDADLSRAARGVVWGALANCGQNCGSVERVYVEQAVAAPFVEAVLREVDSLVVGNPLEETTDVGPLASGARRDAVHEQVTEAVARGARLLRGGAPLPGEGFYYAPTVLLGPPPDCRLMREETSGPVIPIVVVESVERGILLGNDSEYALTASGWTSSRAVAERMMAGLQAGVVTINDVLYSFGEPSSTWSGSRASGVGCSHGFAGLREMSRKRYVSHDARRTAAPVFAFPYNAEALLLARATLRSLHDRRWATRLRALLGLLRRKRFRSRVRLRSFLLFLKRRG